MNNYLIVVDMQKDFITGPLGTEEAVRILPLVKERIDKALEDGEKVIFTRDTHFENYMDTQEGKKLPVMHCIEGTSGWGIDEGLMDYVDNGDAFIINKVTFGSRTLAEFLAAENEFNPIEKVTLVGLCTDICVISNALTVKAFLPEVPIIVDSSLCAGVTPASHENALEAMKMCQIDVI
ncbi:MAG: cysteine hydrolase [Eubacterium sp.]|nr:cysteine hydrolase [Eubacterium sp.]HBE10102.1 amidase [Lachnospiraceae bacterium]